MLLSQIAIFLVIISAYFGFSAEHNFIKRYEITQANFL